jgi:MFS family permease
LAFGILFGVSMLTASGNTALQAVLAVIGRRVGIQDTLIVGVFSLSALAWTLVSGFWARRSDLHGRKAMILVGVGGFAASMLLFGVVVLAGLNGLITAGVTFAGMLVARSIFGFVGSAATPAAQAYVADRTQRQDRVQAMATLASAVGLGTVIGPALAPFLVLPVIGLAGPMMVFALIGVITWIGVSRYLPAGDTPQGADGARPTKATAPGAKAAWRDPRVRPFVAWGFLLTSAQAINTQALAFVVIDTLKISADRAEHFVGIAMMAGALATVTAQNVLIPRFGMTPRSLLRWGAATAAAGNMLIAFAPDYYTVVIAYGLMTLGYGLARPGFTAGASLAVEAHEQGMVAGLMAALNGACYIVGPLLGMALYAVFRPGPFLVNAVILSGLVVAAFMAATLARSGVEPASDNAAEETSSANLPPV